MQEIRWHSAGDTGIMPVSKVPEVLADFEKVANDILKKNGADHVIYASEEYNKDSTPRCINFYNPPIELDGEEFESRVKAAPDYRVYALHKR